MKHSRWIILLYLASAAAGIAWIAEWHGAARFGMLAPATWMIVALWPATGVALAGGKPGGWLRICFAAAVMGYLVTTGRLDLRLLGRAFEHWPWVVLGVALVTSQCFLGVLRWRALLRAQDITLSYTETLRLNLVGFFFSVCIPGAVGGDIMRGCAVRRRSDNAGQAVTTLVMERSIGLVALMTLCLGVAAFNLDFLMENRKIYKAFRILVYVMGGTCAVFWVAMHRGIADRLRASWLGRLSFPGRDAIGNMVRAFHVYHDHRRTLVYAFCVSIAAHATTIFGAWAFAQAVGFHGLPLGPYFLIVPLGLVVNAIPISPGGIGQGQVAFAFLFNLASPGAGPTGVAVMTLIHIAIFLVAAVGGVVYAAGGAKLHPHGDDADAEATPAGASCTAG